MCVRVCVYVCECLRDRDSIAMLMCAHTDQVRVRSRKALASSIFGGFSLSLPEDATKTEIEWHPVGTVSALPLPRP